MRRFKRGQRVRVKREGGLGIELGVEGTVARLRFQDAAAWIELDQRQGDSRVHPFGPDDRRARLVLALPEDCERA